MTPRTRMLALAAAAALVAAAAGFLTGRSTARGLDLRHSKEGGTPVATFAGDAITAEELAKRFAEMSPFARARYQTLEQKKEYVEGLARFELLALEARRLGVDRDPEVTETAKKVMVQRLLTKQLDERGAQPTDAEVSEYFARHRQDYVKPEMFRLSHLFLEAPRADARKVQQKRELAQALLAKAKALDPLDFRAFGALALQSSEEPRTKPLEGDMRYLSEQELTAQYGPEVAEAAKQLSRPGELSAVVQTGRGLHVLKLRARDAALNLSAETVRPQITARIRYETRTQRYDQLLGELKARYSLQLLDDALAKVPVDPQAPAAQASGPTPGFAPPPAPSPSVPQSAPPATVARPAP